jgi:hypothetical protein
MKLLAGIFPFPSPKQSLLYLAFGDEFAVIPFPFN